MVLLGNVLLYFFSKLRKMHIREFSSCNIKLCVSICLSASANVSYFCSGSDSTPELKGAVVDSGDAPVQLRALLGMKEVTL